MSLLKQTIEINKVFGPALLGIIDCFIFQGTVSWVDVGLNVEAFCAGYLLGAFWGCCSASSHTTSPVIIPCLLPLYSAVSLFV